MASLDNIISERTAKLQAENLVRKPKIVQRLEDANIIMNGRKLISFSCNDYLGLSQDKRVKRAAIQATKQFGSGAGASRLITGNSPLYEQLESKLAEVCGTEAAIVFGSGYMANIGAITALVGSGDLIVTDKLAHSCIIEGAKLSGAEFKRFPHNNLEMLEAMLVKYRAEYKNCLIATESIFSMDGDSPDISALQKLCTKHDAWLLVDNAHDVLHLTEQNKTPDPNLIIMGTLSKAAGSYGGYVAGSQKLIDYLKTTAKTFIFTTGLPASVIAASLKALNIIQKEKWRAKKAIENAQYFKQIISTKLDELELGNSNSQIVPLIIGGIEDTVKLSEYLYDNGFLVSAIRPPTVPVNTSRLRFSFSAAHEKKDIDKLAKLLIKYYRK